MEPKLWGLDSPDEAATFIREAERRTYRLSRVIVRVTLTGATVAASIAFAEVTGLRGPGRVAIIFLAAFVCTAFLAWRDRVLRGKHLAELLRADGRRCVNCGYIILGLTSGNCPECGRAYITSDDPESARHAITERPG